MTNPLRTAIRARREKIARAISRGLAPEAVAEKWNVSLATVSLACDKHKVPWPRKIGSPKGKNVYMLLSAIIHADKPLNLSAIADRMGVSRQRVHQVYDAAFAAGIPLPEKRRHRRRAKSEKQVG